MIREQWGFEYPAARLAEAASAKLAFHTQRLVFWREQKDEVLRTIRADGLEVDEKIATQYRSPKSADWDRGARVLVRNDLQEKLQECLDKLKHHTGLVQQYDGWFQALAANPQPQFKLDIEDWLFFFGKH